MREIVGDVNVLGLSNRNIFDYCGARYELIEESEHTVTLEGVNSHVLGEVLVFDKEDIGKGDLKQIAWKME